MHYRSDAINRTQISNKFISSVEILKMMPYLQERGVQIKVASLSRSPLIHFIGNLQSLKF